MNKITRLIKENRSLFGEDSYAVRKDIYMSAKAYDLDIDWKISRKDTYSLLLINLNIVDNTFSN